MRMDRMEHGNDRDEINIKYDNEHDGEFAIWLHVHSSHCCLFKFCGPFVLCVWSAFGSQPPPPTTMMILSFAMPCKFTFHTRANICQSALNLLQSIFFTSRRSLQFNCSTAWKEQKQYMRFWKWKKKKKISQFRFFAVCTLNRNGSRRRCKKYSVCVQRTRQTSIKFISGENSPKKWLWNRICHDRHLATMCSDTFPIILICFFFGIKINPWNVLVGDRLRVVSWSAVRIRNHKSFGVKTKKVNYYVSMRSKKCLRKLMPPHSIIRIDSTRLDLTQFITSSCTMPTMHIHLAHSRAQTI